MGFNQRMLEAMRLLGQQMATGSLATPMLAGRGVCQPSRGWHTALFPSPAMP
jgi:hypothetical protein